jgi:hypothetical protein
MAALAKARPSLFNDAIKMNYLHLSSGSHIPRRSKFVKTAAISKTLFLAGLLGAAFPILSQAQELHLRLGAGELHFEQGDARANEGKHASCEVYAEISVVQAEANRRYNCGYAGPRWEAEARPHFRWCRFARREEVRHTLRDRAEDLQHCFDRMGDFDEDRREESRDRY